MKTICLLLLGVLSSDTYAQRYGGFGRGGAGPGGMRGGFGYGGPQGRFGARVGIPRAHFGFPQHGFINLGIPPIGPIPPLGINQLGTFHHGYRAASFFGGGYPVYGGFDYGAPAPYVVVVQMPAPVPVQPVAPPEKPRPEVREYKDAAPAEIGTAQERASFAIVLRDGTAQSAAAVWVQEGRVHYLTPEGARGNVALDAIDREATQRRNQEKGLQLTLPLPETR